MKESKLYQKFKEKIKKADPNCFWYKIPDTLKLGGKKPFDGILVMRGIPFAIEFKSKGVDPTKYQEYQLKAFHKAGGIGFIYNEIDDMDTFIRGICKLIPQLRR